MLVPRNGDIIPQVTDAATWGSLTTGAYCYYNNDSATYAAVYGKLYNWYAVNDPRGLAPQGWHVATESDWRKLTKFIDVSSDTIILISTAQEISSIVGGVLKETGFTHWTSPNKDASNRYGFSALPASYRSTAGGSFYNMGEVGHWWTSTEANNTNAYYRGINNTSAGLYEDIPPKGTGFSVRCIKD